MAAKAAKDEDASGESKHGGTVDNKDESKDSSLPLSSPEAQENEDETDVDAGEAKNSDDAAYPSSGDSGSDATRISNSTSADNC